MLFRKLFYYFVKQKKNFFEWFKNFNVLFSSNSTIKNNYSIRLLRKGVIKGGEANYVKFFGFSQFTNGFYLIVAKSFTHPNVHSLDLANVNLRVEAYFINPKETKEPERNIIYQSPVYDLNVTSAACGLDYKGGGISCLLYLVQGGNLHHLYGLRIVFRSTG